MERGGEGLEPETSQHNLPNAIRDMVWLHRGSGLRSGEGSQCWTARRLLHTPPLPTTSLALSLSLSLCVSVSRPLTGGAEVRSTHLACSVHSPSIPGVCAPPRQPWALLQVVLRFGRFIRGLAHHPPPPCPPSSAERRAPDTRGTG